MTSNNSSPSPISTVDAPALDSSATVAQMVAAAQDAMDLEFADFLDDHKFYIKNTDEFNVDAVFADDDFASGFTEAQVEAICLLETQRQARAIDKLVKEAFASPN
jgi:hypothetical protein